MRTWKRACIGLLLLSLGGFGCSGFRQSLEDSKRATSALKSELGLDAQVSFRTMNGHTMVAVRLATPPSGDAVAAKRSIAEVVNRSFRAKVNQVNVSF